MTEDILSHSHKSYSRLLLVVVKFLIPFVTCIIGVFSDDFVQKIFPEPFKPDNLPFSAAVMSMVLFAAAVVFSNVYYNDAVDKTIEAKNELAQRLADVALNVSRIGESVGPLLRVLTYEDASALLMEKIEAAEREVLVLSNYNRFDWVAAKPMKLDSARANDNSKRVKNYKRTQRKLSQMRGNSNFKFTKIIQIPKGCRLEDALLHDSLYGADCQFIVESSLQAPARVSLRVSEIIFQNTFVIVDGSFLYLEFDVSNYVDGLKGEPFVMVIEDPGNKFVTNLQNLFHNITSVSTLQKNLVAPATADKTTAVGQST